MARRSLHLLAAFSFAGGALLAVAGVRTAGAQAAQKNPAASPATIQVTGNVSDGSGRPVSGKTIILELAIWQSAIPGEPRQQGETRRIASLSKADGRYEIRFVPDRPYNRFTVKLANRVTRDGKDFFEVLDSEEVTGRLRGASSLAVNFVVTPEPATLPSPASPIARAAPPPLPPTAAPPAATPSPRTAAAAPPSRPAHSHSEPGLETEPAEVKPDSDDQRRILAQHGQPEKVRRIERSGKLTVEWWYYRSGLVYRFQNGELVRSREYKPIQPF